MRTFQLPSLLLAAALAAAGCTSNSPSEPRGNPSNPIPPPPVITYNVSVSVVPAQLQIGAATPATVNVQVRRADNGQPPPEQSEVIVSTTLGELGQQGSGTQQVTLKLVGGNASIALFAGNTAGQATVRATFSQDSGTATVGIEQPATFFVGSVNPQVGDPQGGGDAVINGGGFDPPVRVTFGSATANVRSVNPNQIRVQIPSATAAGVSVPVGTTVPVAVTVTINVNEAGTQTDTLTNGFSYAQGGTDNRQPVIFSVTPTEGTNDGGTEVTINGQNFGSSVQVFFEGGQPLVSVEGSIRSISATRIVVLSPAARGFGQGLRNQRVNIRVKNVASGFETTTTGGFRYGSDVLVTSFGPGQVTYNVPQQVTIFGQGFDDPVTVGLAGVAAAVLSTSGTEIVVRSPIPAISSCADLSGPVSVVNIDTGDGDDTGSTHFTFRVPKPIISNISPTSGGEAGGTSVTITGSGFEDPVRVVFGDQAGSVISVNPNQIVVRTPRFTGTFTTQTCDDNGDGTQGMRSVPMSVDVKVTNPGTTCTDTFQKSFTYTPADVSCRNDSGPPPAPPVAAFSFVKSGLQVNFKDDSTGTVTSRVWNFGDASPTSSSPTPTHTYAAPGNYTVTLTVTGPGGTDSDSQFITVP